MSRNKAKGKIVVRGLINGCSEITLGSATIGTIGTIAPTPSGELKVIDTGGVVLGYVQLRYGIGCILSGYRVGDKVFDDLTDAARHCLRQRDKEAEPRRPHKFNAQATTVDGHRFDSKKEAKRYGELKALEKAGVICNLEMQKPFKLEVNGFLVCTYRADFFYIENCGWVVEDVKGMLTPVYRLKKKLMKACHNIEIKEV